MNQIKRFAAALNSENYKLLSSSLRSMHMHSAHNVFNLQNVHKNRIIYENEYFY